jgi:hypothetical protein
MAEVNEAAGATWRLDERFTAGKRGGAWRIRDGSTLAVLKWCANDAEAPYNPDAPEIVAYLRKEGYPTPAWLASGALGDGGTWWIQELADGVPLRELDADSAGVFLDLVALQRTLALPTDVTWTPYIRALAFGDSPAGRLLHQAGGDVAALLGDVRAMAAPFESALLTESEMIHGDLSVSNLLAKDGRLVAVVDVEAAGRGSAAYDLLCPVLNGLVWESDPQAIERLVAVAVDTYEPAELLVVAACVTIETTAWYAQAAPARLASRLPAIREWLTGLRACLT